MQRDTTKRTVLVAEDHDYDKLILTEVFARAAISADLRFVGDGEQLLDYVYGRNLFAERASAPTPSLILLDLNMPRLDGRKVIRILREDDAKRHLPIIALSTSESEKHINEAYSSGFNAYLVKPASIPDYIEAIRALWRFWMEIASLPTTETASL
ncbi:response regulator [Rhodopseudomonas palustris]|jgi:CheY-like chemotaxis protein|uniref:response regulator n=1 Tax=Rhodopseudomonas TaxID=1073 RepID=UPI0006B9B012|nr:MULTISPECIES: response regulator [Rhodopseudomonas]KPF95067.1 chemotaxis protein CheY [Rhodopseudomonas sp. AAP120]MCP9626138.1 response regulator [Rhodopseudomonas palustris]